MRKVKCGKAGCSLERLPSQIKVGRGIQVKGNSYLVPLKISLNKTQKGSGKKSAKGKKGPKKTKKSTK